MRPRSKIEKEVVALSNKIREGMTASQMRWLGEKAIGRTVFVSGKKAWCSHCGHVWSVTPSDYQNKNGEVKKFIGCPHCHKKGEVSLKRNSVWRGNQYAQVITKYNGWQVIRYYYVSYSCRKNSAMRISSWEIMQKWCKPNVRMITLGACLSMFPYYRKCPYTYWNTEAPIKTGEYHREWMRLSIYPRKSILDSYRKLGMDGSIPDGVCAEELFGKVFSNPYFEMLFKTKQNTMLIEALRNESRVTEYWTSIRVALRHHFVFTSLTDYLDYLHILERLKKDLHNPKYVAPKDWKEMHETIMDEYHRLLEKERTERERENDRRRLIEMEQKLQSALEENEKYVRRIAKYASLELTDGTIDIKPLMSIQEFADEGKEMHHCVFLNEYYREKDSLILSAKVNGKRIETIEIDLNRFVVAQSRGKYNSSTAYHDDILALCNNNMDNIIRMSRRHRKTA